MMGLGSVMGTQFNLISNVFVCFMIGVAMVFFTNNRLFCDINCIQTCSYCGLIDYFSGYRVVNQRARDKNDIFTRITQAAVASLKDLDNFFHGMSKHTHSCVCGVCVHAAWLSSLMDPCSLSDICDSCHQLATCKALNGSNDACFCNNGYTGDGTSFCNGEYKHTAHV